MRQPCIGDTIVPQLWNDKNVPSFRYRNKEFNLYKY